MSFIITPARLSDAPEMARVNVQARFEAYQGVLSPASLEFVSVEKKTHMFEKNIGAADPSCTYLVARDEVGAIVGLATGGPWEEVTTPEGVVQPFGEIFAIYILDKVKGQGLGARLLRQTAQALAEKGMVSAGLSVLENNAPARRFYERMGGVIAGSHLITFGDESYPALFYVWPDIRALFSQAPSL